MCNDPESLVQDAILSLRSDYQGIRETFARLQQSTHLCKLFIQYSRFDKMPYRSLRINIINE